MRYGTVILIAAMLMLASLPAYAHSEDRFRGEVAIEVDAEDGGTFLSIPHQDSWSKGTHIIKHYLEARRGENYGIAICNMTAERIGVVIAVDGRNIITGKRSELKNSEAMYILNAYEDGYYDGWRTTGDRVHKFYFTDTADSYAVRTFGDATAMGVIAVAVFREKDHPQKQYYEKERWNNAPAVPSAERRANGKTGIARDESAGTGFGDERYSPVVRVAFAPERMPIQKTLIKYEWRETLCRKGLLDCRAQRRTRLWDDGGYAPYPSGYRRN
jgi:hypothetical protein